MKLMIILMSLSFSLHGLAQNKADSIPYKEPNYVAQPLYAVFEMGTDGQGRMLAVLDKSKADLAYYDTLYLDMNCDRDLRDKSEKITTAYNKKYARAGMAISLRKKSLKVPGTKLTHTDFLVSTIRKAKRKGIWFRMKWNGKTEVSGGYGPFGSNVTMWSKTRSKAPVIKPNPHGTLTFATWGHDKIEFKPGQSRKVNVIIGHMGEGKDTLA